MPEFRVFRITQVTTSILINAESPAAALENANTGDHHWKEYEEELLLSRVVDPITRQTLITQNHREAR
jgi:hypothetical protein